MQQNFKRRFDILMRAVTEVLGFQLRSAVINRINSSSNFLLLHFGADLAVTCYSWRVAYTALLA